MQRGVLNRPLYMLIFGYLGMILPGALLLLLPFMRRGPLSLIDAIFTSTSAICVTGLIVKDTSHFFTPLGKAVILLWIQIGGIGYMTMATLIFFAFGKPGTLTLRAAMAESFPELRLGKVFSFARDVAVFTLAAEALGFLLLFLGFTLEGLPLSKSLAHALFHSVSAFCNAGFSSFKDSLIYFRGNPLIVLTVFLLFVVGGLGFIVLKEFQERASGQRKKLSLHTKAVLATTASLLLLGFLMIFLNEWQGGLRGLSLKEKILVSIFQAGTPRTAGFTTISLTTLHAGTIFFILMLMAIGGSPGGTAGGMKTTTIFAVLVWLKARLSGREEPTAFGYRIPRVAIRRTFTIVVLAFITIFLATFLLLLFEDGLYQKTGLMPILFEVVSAFGTVGLSLGSTKIYFLSLSRDFSVLGKGVIILTMLIGRVGVLTIGAILLGGRKEVVRYVEGRYVVG
jgi:trk system potassium uptake protein TrkH